MKLRKKKRLMAAIMAPTAVMSNNNIPYQITPCKLVKFESIETSNPLKLDRKDCERDQQLMDVCYWIVEVSSITYIHKYA